MPNSSNDSQNGSTNLGHKPLWTNDGQDICSSKQQPPANFPVPIAQDPEFHITFLSSYLRKLWTKHHYSEDAPFHCICLENPCSIPELLRAFGIFNERDMWLFSRQTDYCLKIISGISEKSIKSSGATKKKLKSRKNSGDGKTSL